LSQSCFAMSLKEAYPQFAQQWHPKLNQGRSSKDVLASSKLMYFWKCRKGPDHEVNTLAPRLVQSICIPQPAMDSCSFFKIRSRGDSNLTANATNDVCRWFPVVLHDRRTRRAWRCVVSVLCRFESFDHQFTFHHLPRASSPMVPEPQRRYIGLFLLDNSI